MSIVKIYIDKYVGIKYYIIVIYFCDFLFLLVDDSHLSKHETTVSFEH